MKGYIKKLLRESLIREDLSRHEIDVMLNSIKPKCDCCKYFDMESAFLGRFGGMEHPIYFMLDKDEIHELEYINPKQYIHNIARGFGLSYDDALGGAYNEEKARKFAERAKGGSKIPIGYYVDNKPDQEGRHRAMAAMMLGCSYMPVVKIEKISRNFGKRFVEEYKDYNFEQMNQMFKEKGYKGISDLDWRTFKRYIEYRL